ncbi:MAG: phosphodiester glycosidase family protein [Armatimonadetes bacterium]|nr:phosphodiester glycosidase family protein [Armatimonadota bacterium]
MRLTAILLVLVPLSAPAQVWEKPLCPGVVYRMEVDTATPRIIHAIRFAREAATVVATPELAQGIVFGRPDDRKGREALSETLERSTAVAAINGDFFPWTGDPLGAMVRDGELISRPFKGRSVFAWGSQYGAVARLNWSGSVNVYGKEKIKLDGFNEQCGKDMAVLNTSSAGYAVSDGKGVTAIFALDEKIAPTCKCKAKFVTLVNDDPRVPVGKGQIALTVSGQEAEKLKDLSKGEEVTVDIATTGLDWNKAKNVVGGGPVIVQNSKTLQAWDAEDFNSEFALKRHPRTAVGYTALGDVWLVIVEGRQAMSVGATVDELAGVMVRLGCVEALNLDGGGSSELAVRGLVVNRPSDGAERPISNSIMIYGHLPEQQGEGEYLIQGKPRLNVGSATDYRVSDSNGRPVPNSSIVWSASGDAWIDQGGRLRPIQAGKATVKAWIAGRTVSLDVIVEAPTAPKDGR